MTLDAGDYAGAQDLKLYNGVYAFDIEHCQRNKGTVIRQSSASASVAALGTSFTSAAPFQPPVRR